MSVLGDVTHHVRLMTDLRTFMWKKRHVGTEDNSLRWIQPSSQAQPNTRHWNKGIGGVLAPPDHSTHQLNDLSQYQEEQKNTWAMPEYMNCRIDEIYKTCCCDKPLLHIKFTVLAIIVYSTVVLTLYILLSNRSLNFPILQKWNSLPNNSPFPFPPRAWKPPCYFLFLRFDYSGYLM